MGNVSGRNPRDHPSPPYLNRNPHPHAPPLPYHQYQGYYPPPYHHQAARVPYGAMASSPLPYVEHQQAVTIRNDINLNKKTLRFVPDEENPGKFLVSFTFDATVSGSITVMFFAREGEEGNLSATREEDLFPSTTVSFAKGLGQKFKQPCGTGIDLSALSETELAEASETDLAEASEADVYLVAVKAEASSEDNPVSKTPNRQITLAVLEKGKGEFKARVLKQILWVDGMRYVLGEIYGIGNTVVDGNREDGNETGKECVICLTEPRDTAVFPCRHMCMCSGCAKLMSFQTNVCPICRQPVKELLKITVNTNGANQ